MVEFLQYHFIHYLALAFIFGLCVGSFLNVVIYRLPLMLQAEWQAQCAELLNLPQAANEGEATAFNLWVPRSHCPHCKHPIAFFLNVPLFGFAWQRAKCRYCQEKISWRYPLVEILAGLLAVLCAWQYGVSYAAMSAMFLSFVLLALVFIDLDVFLLPDNLTLPLVWVGLIVSTFSLFVPSSSAIFGAVLGYLILWMIAKIFYYFTRVEGMGQGDFKLSAAIGAWIGWQLLPWMISIAAVLALIIGGAIVLIKKRALRDPIPFGPFLASSGFIMLFWGKPLMSLYSRMVLC